MFNTDMVVFELMHLTFNATWDVFVCRLSRQLDDLLANAINIIKACSELTG